VTVDPRLLAMFDSRSKTWRIAKGGYKVMLAHDAPDAKAASSVTVTCRHRTLDVRGK
jgi:beta-glucosidase